MQIVIDIPENEYRHIKEFYEKNDNVESTYSYIYHGIPLPKGHGDLKDVSKFIYNCDYDGGLGCDVICHCDNCIHCIITEKAVNTAQTIIPADKEVEDEVSD